MFIGGKTKILENARKGRGISVLCFCIERKIKILHLNLK